MLPEGQADYPLCGSRGRDKNRSLELHRKGESTALHSISLKHFI